MSELPNIVFLESRKTILRPVMKADIPLVLRWINDPETRNFLNAYLPQNEQDEEGWLERQSKNKSTDVTLVIETRAEKRPIGIMGLHGIQWRDRVAITGAVIGEKSEWGKGYGSDAKMALLHYAFNTLNLRKICSHVIAFNERSIKYSFKCGYVQEGILKEHIFRNGKYWDFVQLAVFREGFEKAWQNFQETQ